MKLDDFVAETLKQIIKGVVEAQEYSLTQKAEVNPITAKCNFNNLDRMICGNTGRPLQIVNFDVAVTVAEKQTSGEDGKSVGSITVTSVNSNISQNSSVSRIQFQVPVLLPATE